MFHLESSLYNFKPIEFKVDNPLSPHILPPFPSKSFFLILNGKPGSGKTSVLINMLTNKKIYKKVFKKILLVMPTSSRSSLKDDVFDDLPPDQVFDKLSYDVMTKINKNYDEFIETKSKNKNQLVVMDDIAGSLHDNVDFLKTLAMNRRHLGLSIIILTQVLRDVPNKLRFVATDLIAFKPNNDLESEIVRSEFINLPKKEHRQLMNFVYTDKHDFIFISKEDNKVYKNLNLISGITN